MATEDVTRVVGFYASRPPGDVLRHENACVVAGSAQAMASYIAATPQAHKDQLAIRKARLGDVLDGLAGGGVYAFDEMAYARFFPLAREFGIDIGPEPFPDPSQASFHFVKVSLDRRA